MSKTEIITGAISYKSLHTQQRIEYKSVRAQFKNPIKHSGLQQRSVNKRRLHQTQASHWIPLRSNKLLFSSSFFLSVPPAAHRQQRSSSTHSERERERSPSNISRSMSSSPREGKGKEEEEAAAAGYIHEQEEKPRCPWCSSSEVVPTMLLLLLLQIRSEVAGTARKILPPLWAAYTCRSFSLFSSSPLCVCIVFRKSFMQSIFFIHRPLPTIRPNRVCIGIERVKRFKAGLVIRFLLFFDYL